MTSTVTGISQCFHHGIIITQATFLDSSSVLSFCIAQPMSNTLYYLQLILSHTGAIYCSLLFMVLSPLVQTITMQYSQAKRHPPVIRNLELIENSGGKCFLQNIHENLLPTLKKVLSLTQGFCFNVKACNNCFNPAQGSHKPL